MHLNVCNFRNTWRQALGRALPGLASGAPAVIADAAKGLCKRGCKWLITSAAEADRHDLLFHRKERRADQAKVRRERKRNQQEREEVEEDDGQGACKCGCVLPSGEVCTFRAATQYRVRKHKDQTGHKKARGQK